MANAYNTFETGTASGAVLTGANSGAGTAGTAFGTNFYQAAGATLTYTDSAMHGGLAGQVTLASSGGASLGFAPLNGQQAAWSRGYFNYASTPNANTLIHFMRDGAVTNSGFGVRVTTTDILQFREHVGYTTLASVELTAGMWYRLEVYGQVGGDWEVWLYQGDDTTPLLHQSGSVGSTAASHIDMIRWGAEGASLSATWRFDDLVWSDEGKIGVPEAESVTPIRYVFDGNDWVAVTRSIKDSA